MDLSVDLLLDLENVVLIVQDPDHLVELLPQRRELQDLLFHLDGLQDIGGDIEELPAGVTRVFERHQHLARHIPVEVHVLREESGGMPQQCVELRIHGVRSSLHPNLGFQEPLVGDEAFHAGLHKPVHQNLHESVGELEHLYDLCHGAVGVDVADAGLLGARALLRGEEDHLFALQCLGDGAQRRLTAHQHGKDHGRIHHNVTEREDRKPCRDGAGRARGGGIIRYQGFLWHRWERGGKKKVSA